MAAVIPAAGETFRGEDGTVSTILPENYGLDYEPSDGELEEYAEYVGIDPNTEKDLLWIAKEGLRAPLPDGWRACQTNGNEVYYFNFTSGESLWDHPLDETYKNKVIAERAKRGAASTSSGGGGSARTTSAPRTTGTGSTKAISDALFKKAPSQIASPSLASPSTSGFDYAAEGASAPRAPPDVSDILRLASPGPSSGTNRGPPAPFTLKDAEVNMRKQFEEEVEPKRKALRIQLDKSLIEERRRLGEERAKLKKELDDAWERDRASGGGADATQRRLQAAREVKQVEESWKTRLHELSARVMTLEKEVEEKQKAVEKTQGMSLEEFRASLETRQASELAMAKETIAKQNDVALVKLKEDHEGALRELQERTSSTTAAHKVRCEEALEKKKAAHAKMSAAMMQESRERLEAKKKQLALLTSSANASSRTGGTTPPPEAAEKERKECLAAAERAAEAEISRAVAAAATDLAALQQEEKTKELHLQEELQQRKDRVGALPRQNSSTLVGGFGFASGRSTPTGTPTLRRTGSAAQLTGDEEAKLKEEEDKLRTEAANASRIFTEETDLMVCNKKAGRALTAVPPPTERGGASAEAIASLSRTAAQSQRSRDSENSRFSMAVKRLETQHDQAVRDLKSAHEKKLAAKGDTDPRKQASYTSRITERKRQWLQENPVPKVEMPILAPIPKLAVLQENMEAATRPTPDEESKIVEARLADVRAAAAAKQEEELHLLQEDQKRELETWKGTYRESRLAEIHANLEARKARASAKSIESKEESTAVVNALAEAEAQGKRLLLETESVDAQMQREAHEHDEAMHRLRESMAGLEVQLREVQANLATQQQEERRLQGELARPRVSTPTTAATPKKSESAPEMSRLYIKEEEAVAEEAALRQHWTHRLATLQQQLAEEKELYTQISASMAAAAAASAVASSLPPPVPAMQPAPVPVPRLGVAKAIDFGASVDHSRFSEDAVGTAPYVTSPHTAWMQQGMDSTARPRSPSPWRATAPAEERTTLSPRDTAYEAHLISIHKALRERRRSLRGQQQRIQRLREEWRRDMEDCRRRQDKVQAKRLRQVKEVLEGQARELNAAVLQVKSTSHQLRDEQARYIEAVHRGGMPPPPHPAAASSILHRSGEGEEDLLGVLMHLVERTDQLETLLLQNSSDVGGGGGRRAVSASVLREPANRSRSVNGTRVGGGGQHPPEPQRARSAAGRDGATSSRGKARPMDSWVDDFL